MTTRSRSDAARHQEAGHGNEQPAAQQPLVVGPGESRPTGLPDGVALVATGEETGGSIAFFEAMTPSGHGPPRHIHHGADELFYVLAGEFQILAGAQVITATPGTFVFIPRGTLHALKSIGSEPGRLVGAFVPAGDEQAFEEFATLLTAAGSDPDQMAEAMQAIARKYNSEIVGPPL